LSFRSSFVRIILISVAMVFVIDLFFVPTFTISPLWTLGISLLIQVVGLIIAAGLVSGFKGRQLVRILVISLLTSIVIVFVLQPANNVGIAWTIVSILIIEVSGFGAAEALTRK
jgi:hypothetical protein